MTVPRSDPQSGNSVTREELAALLQESPFHQLLGLTLVAFDPAAQSVTVGCAFSPRVERSPGTGQFHGGVIASLIDIAGDFALIGVIGKGVPTINFRVDYLRPALNADLVARARVRKAGKTVGVVDIDVEDGTGRLIAVGRGCYGTQPG
ncbi:MAG TPA: PaaI family thioesterase [Steroidobacteraceae bacterium]|nr:PaaI family thioesterase [Steroidobacteraceae bacterium]